MRNMSVSFPEMAFVAATRGLGGIGIGLLASDYLERRYRSRIGFALLAVGILTTIPIAFAAGRRTKREAALEDMTSG